MNESNDKSPIINQRQRKTIALFHPDPNYAKTLIAKFKTRLPHHKIVVWHPTITATYLVTWQPDVAIFQTPKLQVVFALGAGVDTFLNALNLPADIAIVRLEEAGMGKQMLEIVLYAILHYSRDMIVLNQKQRERVWLSIATPKRLPFSTSIGILGLGQLGGFVAKSLTTLGYKVSGYSNSAKHIDGVSCFYGKSLSQFLATSEVLINLLPLTSKTENMLNKDLFSKLPKGAYLVNIARGGHLQEEDLMPAIKSGQLSGAFLDVFKTEPLPNNHTFWGEPSITITPHLAAITLQQEAVEQISRNIIVYEKGQPMTGVIDRNKGY